VDACSWLAPRAGLALGCVELGDHLAVGGPGGVEFVRDGAVNPAAPVAVLRALSPAVVGGGDLAAAVRAAAGRFDPAAFAPCRRVLAAYRGQAAARTRAVLYELLRRPVPGSQLSPGAA
jgi:hypothetical protein